MFVSIMRVACAISLISVVTGMAVAQEANVDKRILPVDTPANTVRLNDGRISQSIVSIPDMRTQSQSLAEQKNPTLLSRCTQDLSAFMDDKAIAFASGSARLTDASSQIVDGVADILIKCDAEIVYVEGHTDSDGAESANLKLSAARAETVADVLAAQGVKAERIYAVGYGEGLPIAGNDTQEGKRLNRRIVFSFGDIAASGGQ